MINLSLRYGFHFNDLYSTEGLEKLDKVFLEKLQLNKPELYEKLINYRSSDLYDPELVINLSQVVENFLSYFFGVEEEVQKKSAYTQENDPIISCNKKFIQRRVIKQDKFTHQEIQNNIEISQKYLIDIGFNLDSELEFATKINQLIENNDEESLHHAEIYSSWVLNNKNSIQSTWILFKIPNKKDYEKLIKIERECNSIKYNITHKAHNDLEPIWNLKYCLYCHHRWKDSCSNGLKQADGSIAKNPLGIDLNGCPLEEKISEMNFIKAKGMVIAPIAIAIIDNPMLAATGYKICNDCSRSCIYQKQDAVDIPMIESKILQDVLDLPWGFEIYSLLTRWNPLKNKEFLPSRRIGKRSLIAGLGPAGFTLSHYLLNAGVDVIAIDGLKIEHMDPSLSGIDEFGKRVEFIPIYNIKEIYNNKPQGFGGVAEYGITKRWDKNNLKIIRLLLERRQNFRMYGGVQLGGNIKYADVINMGFSHLSLCLGAGSPNIPTIKNIFAKGVSSASDFLMQLHLNDTMRKNSNTNLQIELPILVIGAGLTAIDTAVESLDYYAIQVEEFLHKFDILGEELFVDLSQEDTNRAKTFIEHAKLLRTATCTNEKIDILKSLGGSSIIYRNFFEKSPAYKINYEELEEGLRSGIGFLENIEPLEIEIDNNDRCFGLRHKYGTIPAKTIFIAAGTNPNTSIAKEFGLQLDGMLLKNEKDDVILKNNKSEFGISYFGDMRGGSRYAGSVVKAIASAKEGYKSVLESIKQNGNSDYTNNCDVDDLLLSHIENVSVIAKDTVELIVKSKLASRNFKPGQFYKFEAYSNNSFFMEGLALTGAEVSNDRISLIVLEVGVSSKMCRLLKKGDLVSLMGPTGEPTEILKDKTVMLIGGGLGNAVLFSIGKALKENNCRVLYFAGYRKIEHLFKREQIESSSDIVVWCCDEGLIEAKREHDLSFNANIVKSIQMYNDNCSTNIHLDQIDRIIVIGSNGMMQAVTFARYNEFRKFFNSGCDIIASINSPMQCMMKGICARCIQRHVDPISGKESYVYSCAMQDQIAHQVDFNFLDGRLKQGCLLEKTALKVFNKSGT